MVKVNESTRNRANTAKTTTPTKIMNGKVKKVRVNINMKNSFNINVGTSKVNSIGIIDPNATLKTRLCFLKLRRNSHNNNNNTLQAQCKVNNKNEKTICEIEKQTRSVDESSKNVDGNVKTTNRDIKANINNQIINITKAKTNNSASKTNLDIDVNNETNTNRSSEISLKPCRIRLKRIDLVKTRQEEAQPEDKHVKNKRIEQITKEYTETVSSSYLSTIPVIDKSKRDNFYKLSLTKSLRKSSENKEKVSVMNSNLEDNQQKKNPESKTIEIRNNNNTEICITNNLKDQTCPKHLGKLSLRRPNGQNNKNVTTNFEVTQFEPQQNSTICFEPARNSTLLEFGFTKDKNKEFPKEKPKEVTSSKDKPSSQNLVNQFDVIASLLQPPLKSQDKRNENEVVNNKESEKENNTENKAETENNILPSNNQTKQSFHRKKEETQEKLAANPKIKAVGTQNNISYSKNQNNKFFHNKKEEAQGNVVKDVPEPKTTSTPKPLEVTKKRRYFTKRSTMVKRDNIYEFLSQSQTSDSDGTAKLSDPTADIIKKLIEQGKVRVATNCKGKGKPKFKRKVPPKKMKKIKQTGVQKLKQLKNDKNKATASKIHDIIDDEVVVENINYFENYESPPDDDYDMENERPEIATKRLNNYKNKNHSNDQEGTFSRLARTVLINEAGRSDLQRKNASLLLEKVRKYISTPKNNQMPSPQAALESELSPITILPIRPATKASPWRVDEDAYLPRTFNFARSSGNLPSFSSDFIPSTPIKEKPKNHVIMQEQISVTNNQNSVPDLTTLQSPLNNAVENIQPQIQTPNENEPSVLSSFSSNDSNAENMAPPMPIQENNNENENIFDLKQLPNPRRALNFRSPLKAINILEVVHLPPYKNANKTPNTKKSGAEEVEMFGFEENLGEESLQADQNGQNIESINVSQQAVNNKKTKNHCNENLFGFEDFLSQTEISSLDCDEINNSETTTNGQNQTIHDKLQNLRKFKPSENELQLSLLEGNLRNPLISIPLFDEGSSKADGMRQRGIKEMLCSTLINPEPSTSKEALTQLKTTNWKHSKRPNFGVELDVSELLFKDPEPETTFNENDAHRTYIRPYKRKRRLKQNKYVMFLDSDESGDENNSGEQRKHQHSHETDTSSEKAPKKKRQRKEPKEKPELTDFVDEFNEMCKEVDSYELIVEKSA
ncbi:protein dalmatian isoform X2 [Calliphora vicina]|uniref:protein dalmatian isoform X2 n=1 Tax=Calliphora vicina TaxID=7373 RepID=UPI00325BF841